jgi:hypothetical protein
VTTTTTQIRAILSTEQPIPTAAEIVRRLGCSRQLVYQTAEAAGIKLPRGKRPRQRPDFITRVGERFPGVRLSSHSAGSAGELLVCADLMYRGWHVYRSMSPHAPADLIAWKGEDLLRIECRSGSRSSTGRLVYGQPNDRLYDVLAVVDLEKRVEYRGPSAALLPKHPEA